ncbi:M48 family metalloprotease [bacterium]|nr:M48 family metalloprotease [bacterium]
MFESSLLNKARTTIPLIVLILLTSVFWSTSSGDPQIQQTQPGALLRHGPGNYYPLLKMLDYQARVIIKDSTHGWLNIDVLDDGSGWISCNALISEDTQSMPTQRQYQAGTNKPAMGVDRAVVGAMIKGLTQRLGVDAEVATPYEPLPGVDEASVTAFRSGFNPVDVGKPLTAVATGRNLSSRYLSLSPVLAAQQVAAWGGRNISVEPYCNQVLLWIADRAGAANITARVYVAMRGGNEFCLPGGIIVIGGDLLAIVEDEAELAGILGHELAHAVFQHGECALEKQSWRIGVSETFAELDAETGGYYDKEIAELEEFSAGVILMMERKHSLDIEFTADSAATIWLARAGYDPEGLLSFLKRLRKGFGEGLTGHGGINLTWLNSRDELDMRIERLEKQVNKLKRRVKITERYKLRFKQRIG